MRGGGRATRTGVGSTVALVLAALPLHADRSAEAYQRDVLPLLGEFCFDCHGDGSEKGGLALDKYADHAARLADHKTWQKADQLLRSHVMPPADKAQPSLAERAAIRRWIDEGVFFVDPERPDPGHVTLRRLNRSEYNHAVRDVFLVEASPADQFPPDDTGYGFDNIGDVLSLSPLLMEKYLRAADLVLDEALALQTTLRVGVERDDAQLETLGGSPREEDGATLLQGADDVLGTEIEIPAASSYRVMVRAARGGDSEGVRLRVELDGEPLFEAEPQAVWKGQRQHWTAAYELVALPAGRHRLTVRLANPGPDASAAIDLLGVAGPFAPAAPVPSPFLRSLLAERVLGAPVAYYGGEDTEGGEGRNSLDTGKSWFATRGFRRAPLLIREAGRYRFRVKAGAQQAGDEPVRFELRLGEHSLGTHAVTAAAQKTQWVEFEREVAAGTHDLQVWFVNEFTDPQTGEERWFWLHEFAVEGPLERETGLRAEEVPDLLARVARRLFGRPVSQEERDSLTHLATAAGQTGATPLEALRAGLKALLVSPMFLFHAQPRSGGVAGNGSQPIDEFTLASRLSFFLWSSVPDEELLELAERGELRASLPAQVNRLLDDPRARAFTGNFAGQWLQLRDLEHAEPDRAAFPEFDAELAADLKRESEMLFEFVLRNNRPVLELLSADYTFANGRLARHYGLPDGPGPDFERVSLAGTPRRGILTHGSILTLTSHPTRTSPVNRGKWILEQLLATPPPPAPNDVPALEDTKENVALPVRERLEAHRADPSCASCHAFLDPMGFALENFDAIGRWRITDEGHPVDASGRLVTGQAFRDVRGLQELLGTDLKADFFRSLARHLLTYALGRGVTWQDKLAVREIVRRCEAGAGFRDVAVAVCESVPFQRMRADSPE